MDPQHIVPPGKKTGCLFRASPFGKCCDVFADKIPTMTDGEISALITTHEGMRKYVNDIFDQDGIGSCAAEATAQALQIARAIAGLTWVQLSPWSLYHYSSGGSDRGSNIDTNLEIAILKGIASMAVWPRSNSFRKTLSPEAVADAKKYRADEFFDIGTVQEFKTALMCGMPVVYGSSGHAKCAVKLRPDLKSFDYANSWDESWGDNGFGVEQFGSGVNWGYGAFAVRTTVE